MKEKWRYLGILGTVILIVLSLIIWKNYFRTSSKATDKQVDATLFKKVDNLFLKEDTAFLRANLEKTEIDAIEDELNRILLGRNITLNQLKPEDKTKEKWQRPLAMIEKAGNMLDKQNKANALFLPIDYRVLDATKTTTEKAALSADELFNEEKIVSSTTTTQSSTSQQPADKSKTTTSESTSPVNPKALLALNGNQQNASLVISDEATKAAFNSLQKELVADNVISPWHQALTIIIDNGLKQVAVWESATQLVNELFDGKSVRTDIDKGDYEKALQQVEKIHNQTKQQLLMERLTSVAQAVGKIMADREYVYEDLANKDNITFTASQHNVDWWQKPISFSLKITNNSNKHLSFAYGNFVIKEANKQIQESQYPYADNAKRFSVKKGTTITIEPLNFNYGTQQLDGKNQQSQLVYILSKTDLSESAVTAITKVTYGDKPVPERRDVEPTIASSSDEIKFDTKKIAALRAQLTKLEVDHRELSDQDVQEILIYAELHELDDAAVLNLVYDKLGLPYPDESEKAPTNN